MNLQAMPGYFFMPQHIILVGASERPYSLGERILSSLLGSTFEGKITPVNLRHKTVAGLKAYPNINKINETADLVIAVTPSESYEALFKACRKKQFHHLILIQDWEALSEEEWQIARQSIQKHHSRELNISVCTPAGIQLPSHGFNSGILPDFPAGHVALLTGHSTLSNEINRILHRMQQGISRHISLNYALTPTSAADWINRFGHNRHTRIAIVHHNPIENQRKLFSALRHFARHTPLILHCTHRVDDTEYAILQSLSRHCNFLLTFDNNALEAALHARLSDLKPSNTLSVLSNTPIAWLQNQAHQYGIQLDMPSEKPRLQEGCLGSTATATLYRNKAVEQLQQKHVAALLAVIAPNADHNEKATSRVLNQLTQQTDKPLLISSPEPEGLLHFQQPEQAVKTLHLRNIADYLQKIQNEIAPPKSGYLKNINLEKVKSAAVKKDLNDLAEALHLPTHQSSNIYPLFTLTFRQHKQYGAIISATNCHRTLAVLPPFSTLDSIQLLHFCNAERYQQEIEQFVYSMNTLAQIPEEWISEITLHIGSQQISSDFHFITPSEKSITEKNNRSTHEISDGLNQKMQAAAEFLRQGNARASEFIRNTTNGAAAEFRNNKTIVKPILENVLAPYPEGYPRLLTLKNGTNIIVRPFEPEDAEAQQKFIRRLSPQSRYTRFMTTTNELPQPTLARFSKLDYHSEGAFIAENSDGLMVAVSRFSRLSRDECEFGITLADDMHGSGLASEMMQLIIRLATQQGYQSMSADILKENTAMLKLAEKSGFSLIESEEDKTLYQAKLNLLMPPEKR